MTDERYSDAPFPERLFSSRGSKMRFSYPYIPLDRNGYENPPDAESIRGEKTDGYCPEPYAAVFPQGTAQPAIRFRHGKRSGRQVRC